LNDIPLAEKQNLKNKTDHYFGALDAAGLTDLGLKTPKRGAWWAIGLFLIGLIPFLVGYLSSWPLMRLAHWSTGRLVKKREFVSSVMMGIGFIAGTVYYLLLLIACICTLQAFWIGLGLSLPILGWFSMFYREMWAGWWAARKAISHPKRAELLALRESIHL
jgi:hypothetical protein